VTRMGAKQNPAAQFANRVNPRDPRHPSHASANKMFAVFAPCAAATLAAENCPEEALSTSAVLAELVVLEYWDPGFQAKSTVCSTVFEHFALKALVASACVPKWMGAAAAIHVVFAVVGMVALANSVFAVALVVEASLAPVPGLQVVAVIVVVCIAVCNAASVAVSVATCVAAFAVAFVGFDILAPLFS